MDLSTLDWDTLVRAFAAFVSFGVATRVCTFQAKGKQNRLGVSLIAWLIVVFTSAQGVAAIFSTMPIPLSSLGITCIMFYNVLVTKGNIAPILRSVDDDMAKETI